jgi:hypothetical protein
MIQDAMEHHATFMFWVLRDTDCIKVKIGLEVDVLICGLFVEVFKSSARKSNWKYHIPSYIMTLFYF